MRIAQYQFRPGWFATLVTLLLLPALLALGTWQLDRAGEKRLLQGELQQRLAAPARELVTAEQISSEWRFRRVELSGRFLSGEIDEVYLMYTKFITAMKREIISERFFPIEKEAAVGDESRTTGEFIFEPDAVEMLEQLMPYYAVSRVYMMLAESFASEHGARMIAMGSATKNAGEMIDFLILTRNRVRQATITKELAEIVGCTEALKYS